MWSTCRPRTRTCSGRFAGCWGASGRSGLDLSLDSTSSCSVWYTSISSWISSTRSSSSSSIAAAVLTPSRPRIASCSASSARSGCLSSSSCRFSRSFSSKNWTYWSNFQNMAPIPQCSTSSLSSTNFSMRWQMAKSTRAGSRGFLGMWGIWQELVRLPLLSIPLLSLLWRKTKTRVKMSAMSGFPTSWDFHSTN